MKKEGSLNLDFNLPQWLSDKESAFNTGATGDMAALEMLRTCSLHRGLFLIKASQLLWAPCPGTGGPLL